MASPVGNSSAPQPNTQAPQIHQPRTHRHTDLHVFEGIYRILKEENIQKK